MSPDPARLVSAAIARLVADDPLASVLLAAAAERAPMSFAAHAALAVAIRGTDPLVAARSLATTRRDREHLAIVEAWLSGDEDRTTLLAREHLASFPDDVVISWLAGRR